MTASAAAQAVGSHGLLHCVRNDEICSLAMTQGVHDLAPLIVGGPGALFERFVLRQAGAIRRQWRTDSRLLVVIWLR